MDVVLVLILAVCCCCCCFVSLIAADSNLLVTNSRYECGIRKQFGVQMVHNGHRAEFGQWPWHAALFDGKGYKCGATLIDQRHVLTSAHCVAKNFPADKLRIHLGKIDLDEDSDHVKIMNVSEIHVHHEFSTNMNDIALLVLSSDVQYSDFIIPICIDSIQTARADDLVGKPGWVAGWGETEQLVLSKQLKTARMPVVNNTECIQSDKNFYSNFISNYVFCAGSRNGTGLCKGDSGGGLYILQGDQWELRGIPSFTALDAEKNTCDTKKFVVFTNVASYYHWIKQKTGDVVDPNASLPKRVSGRKCLQYRRLAKKKSSGACLNARSPHTVAIIDREQKHISSGVIISEKFILTKAPNLIDIFELPVDWDELKVRVGNQQDNEILREISHPDYDQETYRNHLMLLELKTPLIFTESLMPACLANEATENLYDNLILNGYTGLSDNASVFYENNANRLMVNEQCNKSIQADPLNQYILFKEEICTRLTSNATFTWKGIIGGPLQTFNTRSCVFTLIGITKFLIPVNETQYTNVFSRVTNYLDWIEEVVWGNENITDVYEVDQVPIYDPPVVETSAKPSTTTEHVSELTSFEATNPSYEFAERLESNMLKDPIQSNNQKTSPNILILVIALVFRGLYDLARNN